MNNMKLFTTITSERGKPVTKSGNDRLEITLTENRIPKYFIWYNGDKIIIEDIPTEKEILRLER